MFQRLSDFILRFVHHRYSWVALFIYAIWESFLLPIPPDIFLIPMVLARPAWAQRYAFITMLGSVLGGLIGYSIGRYGFSFIAEPVLEWGCRFNKSICPSEALPGLHALFDEHGIWVVAVSAMSPLIPYRLIILVAGLAKMPLIPFIAVSVIFHWLRYALVAHVVTKYGQSAVDFAKGRLQWIFAAGGLAALVLYAAVKYL